MVATARRIRRKAAPKKTAKSPEIRDREAALEAEQREWLASQIERLTTSLPEVTPSQWAETNRYLPKSVSNNSGYYSFDLTPYAREPLDCLGLGSEVRQLAWMKGSQIGVTTNLENGLGYYLAHADSAQILWVTADQEMATQRMSANILPMIQQSELDHRIKSSDDSNSRKTGKTATKLDFAGGGSLRTVGAQNANKLKSDAIKIAFADEVDGWPELVGRDGDPVALLTRRTASFSDSKKIVWVSTPTIKGQSKIERQFLRGDQRYYFVRCLDPECRHPQIIKQTHKPDPETGIVGGLSWDTDPETHRLVPGSVRYLCQKCGHAHRNEDKQKLLSPEYGAEWRPTAVPEHPSIRSYHLSALYSPVGMESWEDCITQWLEAWDPVNKRPRDVGLLHAYYNNILGLPWELDSDKLTVQEVSRHRSPAYALGQVPNLFALEHAGSPIQVLICSVDVQKDDLAVGVFGYAKGRRSFLIDYWRFEGPTESLQEPTTWGRLRDLLEHQVYTADDGKRYRISLTLVDSGYRTANTYAFVSEYIGAVIAIKGESSVQKSAANRLFHQMHTPLGDRAFAVSVDSYKERLHLALRQGWDRQGYMPEGHWLAPEDLTDDQLHELTVERRVEDIDPRSRLRRGWKWVRPSGAKNELLDLSVYAMAGLDMLAWNYCRNKLQLEKVSWPEFWAYTERGIYFPH